MAQKKRNATNHAPEHTIRSGEVAVDIHLRQGNSGHRYRCISFRKIWTSQATGKECAGTAFFQSDQADLHTAIDLAYDLMGNENAQACGPHTGGQQHSLTNRDDQQDSPIATVTHARQDSRDSTDPSTETQENDDLTKSQSRVAR